MNPILKHMQALFALSDWPEADQRVVIACSGGLDSCALAHLIAELGHTQQRNWQICLVHVNHHLRGTHSDADQQFVEQLCSNNKWQCITKSAPLPVCNELGVEERARNLRFEVFEQALTELAESTIHIAHHADDQVETILHRIVRGTGLHGLSGIPERRAFGTNDQFELRRPLLRTRQQQLCEYMQRAGHGFRLDASNDDTQFTRNKIRHTILPMLEDQLNPAVAEALLRLSTQASTFAHFRNEHVSATIEQMCSERTATSAILDCTQLLSQHPWLQSEIIREVLKQIQAPLKRLTYEHVQEIALLASKNVSGKRLTLPDGIEASLDRKRLTLRRTSR